MSSPNIKSIHPDGEGGRRERGRQWRRKNGGIDGKSWNVRVHQLPRVGLSPPELVHMGVWRSGWCGGRAAEAGDVLNPTCSRVVEQRGVRALKQHIVLDESPGKLFLHVSCQKHSSVNLILNEKTFLCMF